MTLENLHKQSIANIENPSKYYVVPIQPQLGSQFQPCEYYKENWDQVTIDEDTENLENAICLPYHWTERNGNFVKIIRPSKTVIEAKKAEGKIKGTPDTTRYLLGAVARTREGEELLPNLFRAVDLDDHESRIFIPALAASGLQGHRSLVLIFWFKDADGGMSLKSTSDPIIKPDPFIKPQTATNAFLASFRT